MKTFAELNSELQELSTLYQQVGAALAEAAERLRMEATLPDLNLESSITSLRERTEAFRKELFLLADDSYLAGVVPGGEVIVLGSLRETLTHLEKAGEQRTCAEAVRVDILSQIDEVLRIQHRDGRDFPALNQCRMFVSEFAESLRAAHWTAVNGIVSDSQERLDALAALVVLCNVPQAASDDECEHLFDRVAAAYGRTLALAAVRGRIASSKSTQELEPAPPAGKNPPPDHQAIERGATLTPEALEGTIETAVDQKKGLGTLPFEPQDSRSAVIEEEPLVQHPAYVRSVEEEAAYDKEVPVAPVETAADSVEEAAEAAPGKHSAESNHVKPVPIDIHVNSSCSEIAGQIKSELPHIRQEHLQDLIWQLLAEGRASFAYHLSRCVNVPGDGITLQIPTWLLSAHALSAAVRFPNGEIASRLRSDFHEYYPGTCFSRDGHDWNQAMRLLILSSALRPTLLAPGTGAGRLLRDLHLPDGLGQLYWFIQQLAELAEKTIPIDPSTLTSLRNESMWSEEVKRLQAEAIEWFRQSQQATILYAPATKVWQNWTIPGHLIHQAIAIVQNNRNVNLDHARHWLDEYSSTQAIDRAIHTTDRSVLRRRTGKDIEARAIARIRSKVAEVADFLRRWVQLQDQKPGQDLDFRSKQAEKVAELIRQSESRIFAELISFLDPYQDSSRAIRVAGDLCRQALRDTFDLFQPSASIPEIEPRVRSLLNAPLLFFNCALTPDSWEWTGPYDEAFLGDFFNIIHDGSYDFENAFLRFCEERDHEATLRIVEHLEEMKDGNLLARVREKRKTHLEECRRALERDAIATTEEIEKAVALGLFAESERLEQMARVESVRQSSEELLAFKDAAEKLKSIRDEISKKKDGEIESVRKRLTEQLGENHLASSRILQVLETGDVHTASEYVRLALDGQEIPKPDVRRNILEEFFIEKFAAIESFLEAEKMNNWGQIIHSLENHARGKDNVQLGPIDINDIRDWQARSVATLLDNWFTLKRSVGRSTELKRVRSFLDALGFNDVECTLGQHRAKNLWINLKTRALKDRTVCPVPQYGSMAGGLYRLLLIWHRPTEDELVNEIGETSAGAPVIVFYFGRLTERRRRDLAGLCRVHRRTFVLLDDTLLLFLCGEKQSRLPAFWTCTLPFTFIDPYTTTAGLVPPEVFFGRQRERDNVMDPFGGCFIFGGRQLGKTALLRDVERRFNEPEAGRIAIFIDLKTNGIGLDRPIDDIWRLIEDEMKVKGVITPAMRTNADPLKIGRAIKEWLDTDERRRILLMMDEADRFLSSDGKRENLNEQTGDFTRTARLKGWMDDTQRRFKVIFAGLHNVQRTTRLSNHPLAQYGEPMCIGPLFNNGEMREARALVELPLEKCGFQFSADDLSMRILAQTNYYPSLIQLYCSHLLRYVNDPNTRAIDPAQAPPYQLRPQHVEAAYRSQDLRKAIRDRFLWTLQLDPRYEVIAYSIARGCIETRDKEGITQGFSQEWIENEILAWWPTIFSARQADFTLDALLLEMVDLGILRQVNKEGGKPYYTLRSPNVLLLLGTDDEIETQLLRPRELEPPYEAATFRSAYRGQDHATDSAKRSPLTTEQEQMLRVARNGITIVTGSDASGLGDLRLFLQGAAPAFFVNVVNCVSINEFRKIVEDLSQREQDGTTILFVGHEIPWSKHWIDEAAAKVSRLTSKNRHARVIFEADPETFWRFLIHTEEDLAGNHDIMTLQPWHESMVRLWLDDCGYQVDAEGRQEILRVTGYWPWLLLEFKRRACDKHGWQQALAGLDAELQTEAFSTRVAQCFAITGQSRILLRTMSELGDGISIEDLGAFIEGMPQPILERAILWGRQLSYISPGAKGTYSLDPVLALIMTHCPNKG